MFDIAMGILGMFWAWKLPDAMVPGCICSVATFAGILCLSYGLSNREN